MHFLSRWILLYSTYILYLVWKLMIKNLVYMRLSVKSFIIYHLILLLFFYFFSIRFADKILSSCLRSQTWTHNHTAEVKLASVSGKNITSKLITQTWQPQMASKGIGTKFAQPFIIGLMLPRPLTASVSGFFVTVCLWFCLTLCWCRVNSSRTKQKLW